MGALKAVGGIIGLVSGILVFIIAMGRVLGDNFFNLPYFDIWNWLILGTPALMWINLIFSIVVIIGGFLGLIGKRAGGAILLIIGLLWIIGAILPEMGVSSLLFLYPMSFFVAMSNAFLWVLTIESILIVIAGIMILAGGADN